MIVRPSEYLEKRLQVTLNQHMEKMIDQDTKVVLFPAGHTVLTGG